MKKTVFILIMALAAVTAAAYLAVSGGRRAEAAGALNISPEGVLLSYNVSDGMAIVSLPPSVTAIADEAFMGDVTLERINIPSSVTYIGRRAFYGCKRLMSITLQEGTESIGESSFAMCPNLTDFSIPSSLSFIGDGAFAGDSSLENMYVSDKNPYFTMRDKVLYTGDGRELVVYLPGRGAESCAMSNSVEKIRPYAFWGAKKLKYVFVSENVERVGPFAFTNVPELEFVYLPSNVLLVEEFAFRDDMELVLLAAGNSRCAIDSAAVFQSSPSAAARSGLGLGEAWSEYLRLKNTGSVELPEIDREEVVSSNGTSSGNSAASGNSAGRESAAVSQNASYSAVISGGKGRITDTPWGINAPYKDIDTSSPEGLYGYGRLVGGSTIIFPVDR